MGVFVIGMHRSGTSALTRLLVEIGLFPGEASELMPATEDNEAGYFEVSSLTRHNDSLLAALGGSALAPPLVQSGSDDALEGLQGRSAHLFDGVYRDKNWVWKDPRNCLLLPYWLSVVGRSHVVVMIYRAPAEVAASLVKRDAISMAAALALWEFYARESMLSVRSLPVYVTSYELLLADPRKLAGEVSEFLDRHGIGTVVESGRDLGVDACLRHQVSEVNTLLTPSQIEMFDVLGSLVGEHSSFEAPELAPVGDLSEALLQERRVSVGSAEKARNAAEADRNMLEDKLRAAADELSNRQSVIDGLITELELRSSQMNDALTEAARWRASIDRLAAECDKRDLRLGELERDLEVALARIHVRAATSK